MSDIPDGLTDHGVRMAIAWEIAKKAFGYARDAYGVKTEHPEGMTAIFCDLFNRAFYGLLEQPKQAP